MIMIIMITIIIQWGEPAARQPGARFFLWLLVYNNEAHNLVERKNRKDIQIREQQFFDHYLKGAAMPTWMSEGVPAIMKGRDWGLKVD